MNNGYVFKVLIAIDVLIADLIWRDSDITISSFTGLALRKTSPPLWAKILGWTLNHIQTNHCELAITNDALRAKAALAILEAP